MPSDADRRPFGYFAGHVVLCCGVLGLVGLYIMVLGQKLDQAMSHADDLAGTTEAERGVRGHTLAVRDLSLSDDGQFLDFVQGHVLWQRRDAHTGRELASRNMAEQAFRHTTVRRAGERFLTLKTSAQLLVVDGQEILWDGLLPEQQPEELITGFSGNRQDDAVAVVSDRGSLWRVTFDGPQHVVSEHFSLGQPLQAVAMSPTGARIAMVTGARQLLIWDVARAAVTLQPAAPAADCRLVAWSGDGTRLIAYGHESDVLVWDADSGDLIRRLSTMARYNHAAQLSADGRVALVSEDNTIGIWEVDSGDLLGKLKGHAGLVSNLCLAEGDRTLFSGDFKGEVRRWSLSDQRLIWSTF